MIRRMWMSLVLGLAALLPLASSARSADIPRPPSLYERTIERGLDTRKFPEARRVVYSFRDGFPHLGDQFEVVDPYTGKRYNCISHSLGINSHWVNPETGPNRQPLSRMDVLYHGKGYRRVPGLDYGLVPGMQKVVVYAKVERGQIVQITHAALQERDGTWSSKLGQGPLIRHLTPTALNGPDYGVPVAVYERPRSL